jgi:hypothetical protein
VLLALLPVGVAIHSSPAVADEQPNPMVYSLDELRLLNTAFGRAVLRAPDGALVEVGVGAAIGAGRAVVVAIEPDRLVADETVIDASGRASRARVIFHKGGAAPDRYRDVPSDIQPPTHAPSEAGGHASQHGAGFGP